MEKRPHLENIDLIFLKITKIAAGVERTMSESEIVELLPETLELVLGEKYDSPEEAVKQLYASIQCRLMAFRKDDFATIQQEAPFNRQGQANLISLASAFRNEGKDKALSLYRELVASGKLGGGKNAVVEYSGGPGDHRGNAVVIHSHDSKSGVAAEYWYLNYTYGAVKVVDTVTVTGANSKVYDQVGVDDYNGERICVIFDVSEFAKRKSPSPPSPEPIASKPQTSNTSVAGRESLASRGHQRSNAQSDAPKKPWWKIW